MSRLVILVHGWSVHHTSTYGELAQRLAHEARVGNAPDLDLRQIWLSKYVSFDDEIRIPDLSRALHEAISRELGGQLDQGKRFVCITHSTGGPVVRHWFNRFFADRGEERACPMSHLIMLAPPNHGSALATLGKSRLGRIKAWFEGVEPGRGVLDFLTLGSDEAWRLNLASMHHEDLSQGRNPVFSFVLTGQSIDRKMYDFLNSYTGEAGSDGVVRAAAANLNTRYVRLVQPEPVSGDLGPSTRLLLDENQIAPRTAFALIPGASHSGRRMGIMKSIRDDDEPHPTVNAILDCLKVEDARSYRRLCDRFEEQNRAVMDEERVDRERLRGLPDRRHIIDPHAMLIFRVRDSEGRSLSRMDLLLCAGPHDSPNELPRGFLRDRQKNNTDPGALSFYLNQAVMNGAEPVEDSSGHMLRGALPGAERLGVSVDPHLTSGLAHYLPGKISAQANHLTHWVRPHATTMVEIVMQRIVHEGAFSLTRDATPTSFKRVKRGDAIG